MSFLITPSRACKPLRPRQEGGQQWGRTDSEAVGAGGQAGAVDTLPLQGCEGAREEQASRMLGGGFSRDRRDRDPPPSSAERLLTTHHPRWQLEGVSILDGDREKSSPNAPFTPALWAALGWNSVGAQ